MSDDDATPAHDADAAPPPPAPVREQASGDLFRLLADNVPALIAYYRNGDYRCQFANTAYATTFGQSTESIIGLTVAEVIGEAAWVEIRPHVDQVLLGAGPVQYERQLSDASGAQRWLEVNLLPHSDEFGATIGAFVLIHDISRHRLAERAVRESEARLAKFMQASVEGIVFHKDGIIIDANPPMLDLTGYSLADLLGRRTLEFIPPDEVAKVAAVLTSGQETAYESALIDKRGQRIAVEFIVRTMERDGERFRMAIVRDIRDRHAAQARIHHLAHHDPLTGLPNRTTFMDRIEAQILASAETDATFALLFIDLDHFKRVNDSLGHLAGDTLLRTAASRIVASLRATDVVARFGGDEFMVLLPTLASADARHQAAEVASKLLHAIAAPLVAEGRPISVTPSIGIAVFPEDGATPDELVKHADSAMYEAKARGRAKALFFDRGTVGSAYAALVVEGQLGEALERGEFELHFQPQVDAQTGATVGAEALIRWNHPERGLLLPDEFIPVAERQRLILPIGQWVLREGARCAQRWRAAGLPIQRLAVNLSTAQFQSTKFIEAVEAMMAADASLAELLELELTERMLMDDVDDVRRRLERLKALGLRISIDDFGTGYSSLGHLKDLPIDKVKIDRSFVTDLPVRSAAAIVVGIIQMAHGLGMSVIAEGVETDTQRLFLAHNGCDQVQGTLFSGPLPRAQFETWMLARMRREAASAA